MDVLDLIKLQPLMDLTLGWHEIKIGLIDGPVAMDHPDLSSEHIREISGKWRGACTIANSTACTHGTFVAGILSAKRGCAAPAICPNCTLLVRPIFTETSSTNGQMPSATPPELADAIVDCIEAGTRVLNLSAALAQPSTKGERELEESLDYAARRGVIIVAAAGNQGTLGSTVITRHPWVIPVVAYDIHGRPLAYSNLGNSIGRHGLGAPGKAIRSLVANGKYLTLDGTSVAAPFVTGAIALLWSEFPKANAIAVKTAITQDCPLKRTSIVPPLLNAWGAYRTMITNYL